VSETDPLIEVVVHVNHPIPANLKVERLERMVVFALQAEERGRGWSVSVVLVGDSELQELHHRFMDIDEPTDCMTFPRDPEDDHEPGGDIVISVDRAAEQGPESGLTAATEIEFLAVHGVLHLCEWDDQTDEDRAAMHARQREIIEKFNSIESRTI
jgi:probable rRNA maturation factor